MSPDVLLTSLQIRRAAPGSCPTTRALLLDSFSLQLFVTIPCWGLVTTTTTCLGSSSAVPDWDIYDPVFVGWYTGP